MHERLRRPCRYCGRMYSPQSQYSKICLECYKEAKEKGRDKLRKRRGIGTVIKKDITPPNVNKHHTHKEKKVWRSELQKYYKRVFKCKLKSCGRLFGSDQSDKSDKICPRCLGTLNIIGVQKRYNRLLTYIHRQEDKQSKEIEEPIMRSLSKV